MDSIAPDWTSEIVVRQPGDSTDAIAFGHGRREELQAVDIAVEYSGLDRCAPA